MRKLHIVTAGFLLALLASFQSVTQAGPVHLLGPAQISKLKALKARIMVPGFVPPGYKLERVEGRIIPKGGPGGGRPEYSLRYTCICGGKFLIEGTGGGIGSRIPGPESEEQVWNAVLGNLPLGTYRHPDGVTFSTDWFGKGEPLYYSFEGSALPKAEAIRIVKALTFL